MESIMAKYSKKASKKVARAMHERKRGTLAQREFGQEGDQPQQAVAIGLSEARRAGAKVPAKPATRTRSKRAA